MRGPRTVPWSHRLSLCCKMVHILTIATTESLTTICLITIFFQVKQNHSFWEDWRGSFFQLIMKNCSWVYEEISRLLSLVTSMSSGGFLPGHTTRRQLRHSGDESIKPYFLNYSTQDLEKQNKWTWNYRNSLHTYGDSQFHSNLSFSICKQMLWILFVPLSLRMLFFLTALQWMLLFAELCLLSSPENGQNTFPKSN